MKKLQTPDCPKCGSERTLRYVKSTGMDIEPVGMFADCPRCDFSGQIRALDEKQREEELINRLESSPKVNTI